MTIRRLILATTILAAGAAGAFAQSSPAPANQSGGGVSATTPAPTDQSISSEGGNSKGVPARGTNAQSGKAQMGTTSAGVNRPPPGQNMIESQQKNQSPASQDSGVKKEK